MRFILLTVVIAFSVVAAKAQQWSGSTSITGTLNRTGMIGIDAYNSAQLRLNSMGTYYGKIGNPSSQVWSLGWGTDATDINSVLSWTGAGRVGIGTVSPQKAFEARTGLNNFVSVGEMLGYSPNSWSGIHFGYLETDNSSYRKSALVFERVDGAARGKIHLLNNADYNGNSATLADSKVTIDFTGYMGLGTTGPNARLSFPNVDITVDPEGITWYNNAPLNYGIYRTAGSWISPNYQQLKLRWVTGIVLDPGTGYGKTYVDIQGDGLRVTSGNVGIGTISTGTFKLAVEGKIGAREVVVTSAPTWPDYVFSGNYKLPSLLEVERYIKANKHLPDVPSAEEVKDNGLSLGQMNAILLKKVEELTLHLIRLQKEVDQLKENK